jgi:hypothetical protein
MQLAKALIISAQTYTHSLQRSLTKQALRMQQGFACWGGKNEKRVLGDWGDVQFIQVCAPSSHQEHVPAGQHALIQKSHHC